MLVSLQSTKLVTYSECPRKYYYNFIAKRSKPQTEAMKKGSCFHKIHELYFGEDIDLFTTQQRINEENPEYSELLPLCMDMFCAYLDNYSDIEFVKLNDRNAVELEFEVQLSDDVVVRGKFDALRKIMGKIYVCDLKVTGQYLSDWYFQQYEMCYQTMLYSYVAKEFYSDVVGFIIDAVHNRNANFKFQRQFFAMLPNVEDFILAIVRTGRYIRDNYQHEDAFERRYTSCVNKYGKCAYFDVCSSPKHVQEKILQSELFIDYTPIYNENIIGLEF